MLLLKTKILYSIFSLFLIGTITTTSILSNYDNNAYSQSQLQNYENEKYGIKVQYPADWELQEYETSIDKTGKLVVDFHPLKIEGSVVSLLVYSLSPENATLESFTEKNLKSIQTSTLKNETIKILNQNSSATLGGQPAFKVIYENTFTDPLGEIQTSKRMSIWTVLESKAYQFTFSTSSNDKQQYDQYIEAADRIINSFEPIH